MANAEVVVVLVLTAQSCLVMALVMVTVLWRKERTYSVLRFRDGLAMTADHSIDCMVYCSTPVFVGRRKRQNFGNKGAMAGPRGLKTRRCHGLDRVVVEAEQADCMS